MSTRKGLTIIFAFIVGSKTTSQTSVPRSKPQSFPRATVLLWLLPRKIKSNFQNSAQIKDYIELLYTAISSIQLNVSALSEFHSLFISLNKIPFQALVNSESTYYFVDSKLIGTYNLKTFIISPIVLYFFDNTLNSIIFKIVVLSMIFPSNEYITLNFYVILLNFFYFLVLGYNQLT